MSDAVERLKAARDALAKPGGWRPAAPPQGAIVNVLHEICPDGNMGWFWTCLYAATSDHTLSGWERQEGRTQAEVVAAFDRAIILASAAL